MTKYQTSDMAKACAGKLDDYTFTWKLMLTAMKNMADMHN